ncbi:MAG: ABC transporter permease [Alphaproteobacteria bacterium]|nr:ABC transporter permease [Alphaproteobacteria bacterium]
MNLTSLALRNLRRRPVRSGLSILGIGLAVGSALALMSLSHSIKDSTRAGLDEMGDDLVVMQKNASDIFGGFIAEDMVARVAAVPGVARAAGELFMFAPSAPDRNMLTQGWADNSYLWKKVPLREGRVPSAGERGVAVLGEGAAAALGKKVGDEVTILGATFRVIGIANYTALINRGLILMPLPDLQKVSLRPNQVTMIHVNIDRNNAPSPLDQTRSAIEALGNVTASTANEVLNKDRNFAILDAVSLAIALIAIAMGAIYVLNALVMATQERTREIGIFAAIGWSRPRIMASILVEGIVLCLVGCALGLALSFAAATAFPRIPAIGDLVSFSPSPTLIGATLAAAFVLCVLGAMFPAWRAIRMLPAEALRRI